MGWRAGRAGALRPGSRWAAALLLAGILAAACGGPKATPTPSPPPPKETRSAPTAKIIATAAPTATATRPASTPAASATPEATATLLPKPSATEDTVAQALATLAAMPTASPTTESGPGARSKPTPKPLELLVPTPTPTSSGFVFPTLELGGGSNTVWMPLLFKGPALVRAAATPTVRPVATATSAPTREIPTGGIVVTIRGYDYSRWGRPAGMDDPRKPCGDFDDSRPVRKLTASVTVKNVSEQTMKAWAMYFKKNNGQWAYVCIQGYDRIPNIAPGRSLEITFSAWMETNETISYGVVYDEVVGISNVLTFP